MRTYCRRLKEGGSNSLSLVLFILGGVFDLILGCICRTANDDIIYVQSARG